MSRKLMVCENGILLFYINIRGDASVQKLMEEMKIIISEVEDVDEVTMEVDE